MARLLEAVRALRNDPIEFLIVGPMQIRIPEQVISGCRVRFIGHVARENVAEFYSEADLFLLPTLSDGFALTQLEAVAQRLPLVASAHCGEIVRPGENGLLLENPTPEAIEGALRFCLEHPDRLTEYSRNAALADDFSVRRLGERLLRMVK